MVTFQNGNFLHLFAFRQLIDQFIEVACISNQGVLELLDSVTADYSGYELGVRIQLTLFEKSCVGCLSLDE